MSGHKVPILCSCCANVILGRSGLRGTTHRNPEIGCELFVSVHSISLDGEEGKVLLDYSKNIVTKETMKLLFNLVHLIVL